MSGEMPSDIPLEIRRIGPGDEQELVPSAAAIIRSITHAVVIKREDIFFLSETDGSVPLALGHGFGLYYHDCRYLNGYELTIGSRKPEPLVWNAEGGDSAIVGLSNPEIRML